MLLIHRKKLNVMQVWTLRRSRNPSVKTIRTNFPETDNICACLYLQTSSTWQPPRNLSYACNNILVSFVRKRRAANTGCNEDKTLLNAFEKQMTLKLDLKHINPWLNRFPVNTRRLSLGVSPWQRTLPIIRRLEKGFGCAVASARQQTIKAYNERHSSVSILILC